MRTMERLGIENMGEIGVEQTLHLKCRTCKWCDTDHAKGTTIGRCTHDWIKAMYSKSPEKQDCNYEDWCVDHEYDVYGVALGPVSRVIDL